jgi:hypothetical protein
MAQEDGNAVEDHDPFEVALRSLPLEEPRRGWDGKGPKGFKRPVESVSLDVWVLGISFSTLSPRALDDAAPRDCAPRVILTLCCFCVR